MTNLTSIDLTLLDSVTGGAQLSAQQRELVNIGTEAKFCNGLDARAKKSTPAAKWTAARKQLADLCWGNLRDNVSSR